MKRYRKSLRALFGFDRRERRGTFILSLILVSLLLVRLIALGPGEIPAEILPPEPLPLTPDDAAGGEKEGQVPASLFFFDPNTCSYDDLIRLGLTARQARILINYRGSGARFRRPEDLKRVYGIDSAAAARLIPYINIAETPGNKPEKKSGNRINQNSREKIPLIPKVTERVVNNVDLNMCDADELVSLPGIGPVLAERIIKYRNLLGGFVEAGQLSEVYGLDSSIARMAAGRITLTYDSVRPIMLDSVSFSDLARHPYIGYETARQITRYRTLAGGPLTLGRMVGSGVITPDQAGRIAPYVKPAQGIVGNDYEFISSKVLK